MTGLHLGDVVWHYADGQIKAVGPVVVPSIDAQRPPDLPTSLWGVEGRLARVIYHEAETPPIREDIPEERRLEEDRSGPFQRDGKVKTGYLFPVTPTLGKYLTETFRLRFPDWNPDLPTNLPAEVMDSATHILRRLLGVRLHTIKGHENWIIEIQPDFVLVGTDRSPAGQPVPIRDLEAALTKLRMSGEIIITPENVGYRSAFLGAVLRTLPGAIVSESPPSITLDIARIVNPETAAIFDGILDRSVTGTERGEQIELRRTLLGNATEAQCALCGATYPVRFLCAAHIKKRSMCSDDERRDLAHIAMPACYFGCDILFETGYIAVNGEGCVVVSPAVVDDTALGRQAMRLNGRICQMHTSASARYFEWHYANQFLGDEVRRIPGP